MDIKRKIKSYLGVFIIFTALFLVACGSTEKESEINGDLDNQTIEDTDSEEIENSSIDENESIEEVEGNESEEDQVDPGLEDELEVIDGSPVGPYKVSDKTDFMLVETDPDTRNNKFKGFIAEGHPYIAEIGQTLEDLYVALYEIDYQTLTDNRHEPFLTGELDEDSDYRKIAGAISNEVITEVVSIDTKNIDFQVGMETARVSSAITYNVLQSNEQPSVWNKYLEGETFVANSVAEVERIDDQWVIKSVIAMTVDQLED